MPTGATGWCQSSDWCAHGTEWHGLHPLCCVCSALQEAQNKAADEAKRKGQQKDDDPSTSKPTRHDTFPPIKVREGGHARLLLRRTTSMQCPAYNTQPAHTAVEWIYGCMHAPPPYPAPQDGERFFQKNEGKWEFTLGESEDGASVLLDVEVGESR